MAVALAALRQVHGDHTIDERVSSYALAEEVSATHRGMMIAIPVPQWECFRHFSLAQMALVLLELDRHVRLSAFRKKARKPKTGPKKKRAYNSKRPHVSTAKQLREKAKKETP